MTERVKFIEIHPHLVLAFLAGMCGVAGVCAYLLRALLPDPGNLLPLAAVVYGFPIGAVLGIVGGLTRLLTVARAPVAMSVVLWLLAAWGFVLLYTSFLIDLATGMAVPAIGLQILIAVWSGAVVSLRRTRARLPAVAVRHGAAVVVAIALVAVASVFPPVVRAWWGPKASGTAQDSSADLPSVAFVMDARFDSSRHVPMFAVDRRRLGMEWALLAVGALGIGTLCARLTGRSSAPGD